MTIGLDFELSCLVTYREEVSDGDGQSNGERRESAVRLAGIAHDKDQDEDNGSFDDNALERLDIELSRAEILGSGGQDSGQESGAGDSTDQLCDDVDNRSNDVDLAVGQQTNGDARVDVTARDVTQRLSHRHNGQTEGEGSGHQTAGLDARAA